VPALSYLHPALNAITNYLSGENEQPHRGYIGGSMEFRGGAKTNEQRWLSCGGNYLPGLNADERGKGLLLCDLS